MLVSQQKHVENLCITTFKKIKKEKKEAKKRKESKTKAMIKTR